MDRSRHVYLDITLTQREVDMLIGRLRSDTFGMDVFNQLANVIEDKALDSNPELMMEVSFASQAIRETQYLCLNCDQRPCTDESAECEVCEQREVIPTELTPQGWRLETVEEVLARLG